MSDAWKAHQAGWRGELDIGKNYDIVERDAHAAGAAEGPGGGGSGARSGGNPAVAIIVIAIPMLAPFWFLGAEAFLILTSMNWPMPVAVAIGAVAGIGLLYLAGLLYGLLPRPAAMPVLSLYAGLCMASFAAHIIKVELPIAATAGIAGALLGYLGAFMASNPMLHHRIFSPLIALGVAAGVMALSYVALRSINASDSDPTQLLSNPLYSFQLGGTAFTGMAYLLPATALGLAVAAYLHLMFYSRWTFFGGIALGALILSSGSLMYTLLNGVGFTVYSQ